MVITIAGRRPEKAARPRPLVPRDSQGTPLDGTKAAEVPPLRLNRTSAVESRGSRSADSDAHEVICPSGDQNERAGRWRVRAMTPAVYRGPQGYCRLSRARRLAVRHLVRLERASAAASRGTPKHEYTTVADVPPETVRGDE